VNKPQWGQSEPKTCKHGAKMYRHRYEPDVPAACPFGTCPCCKTVVAYLGHQRLCIIDGKEVMVSGLGDPGAECDECGGPTAAVDAKEEVVL